MDYGQMACYIILDKPMYELNENVGHISYNPFEISLVIHKNCPPND